MNEEVIKKAARDFNNTVFSAASVFNNSTNENWTLLKSKVDNLLTSHVPQKIIKQRWDVPWMTPSIRRLIRKNKRMYNAYKSHANSKNWEKFTKLRKTAKSAQMFQK